MIAAMIHTWKAFGYALCGLRAAWRDEVAFRQEVLLALVMVPLACFLAPDKYALILMIGSVLLVLMVELLNTAIEAAINRISTDMHPLAKKAKDTASAAVFVALLNAGLVWGVVLFF